MFEGFEDQHIDVGEVALRVRHGGDGLPVLLVHGRTVRCPTLFLWSSCDDMEDLYGDPLEVWRPWVDDLYGRPIDSGHHMAEENPAALSEALLDFLSGWAGG